MADCNTMIATRVMWLLTSRGRIHWKFRQEVNYHFVNANTVDNARLDVKARGFFREGQTAFFDVRIANVNAESTKGLPMEAILRKAENEKKRMYNQRVIEIEQGTFTPLVFGTNGAMAKECQIFHKLLAKKLSMKQNIKYCKMMSTIGTQISFSLLRSMLLCIRGSRTVFWKVLF